MKESAEEHKKPAADQGGEREEQAMGDDDKRDLKVVADNTPESIAKYGEVQAAEDEARAATARQQARERRRRSWKVEAPDGIEFSITVYLRSDSTNLELVREFATTRVLRALELPTTVDPNELAALWWPKQLPSGPNDWRFMTHQEIAEHKRAANGESDDD
jgi:hypothetical protein